MIANTTNLLKYGNKILFTITIACKSTPCNISNATFRFCTYRCQELFLESVKIGENIAKNKALKENIFMMVTCIEQRIPLFLVGKPGSSKSLTKTIVADSMQEASSHTDLFKAFKRVSPMLKSIL